MVYEEQFKHHISPTGELIDDDSRQTSAQKAKNNN